MASNAAAFALVASEYEKTGDAILGFAPLFAPLIAARPGEVFDPATFSQEFTARYGLSMSAVVARALSERLEQIGLLSATKLNGTTIYRCADGLQKYETVDETEVSNLASEFSNSVTELLADIAKPIPPETLEREFLERLARPEFTAAFLTPERTKRGVKLLSLKAAKRGSVDWENSQALDVLTADFVLELHEKDPARFATLSAVTYGALVADAVSAFATPRAKEEQRSTLRAVIDGPLLLDALDINTPENREYAVGLLKLLSDAQISLATFDHVVDEMRRTIRTTLDLFNRNQETYGALAGRLRVSPGHALYATYIADALEDEIKRLGVTVLRTAIYDETRFARFFPDGAIDSLRNSLGEVHFNLERRITDARSVASVIRLKGENRSPSSVLESGTVFVTRNASLAKSVNRVLAANRAEPDPRFVCLTDAQLAGVVWFSSGMSGSLLSQRRLIANCATAIAPRLEVVMEMSKTLGRLGEDRRRQFEALMQDRRAALCPMRLTAGHESVISEDLAERTLDEMKAVVAEPLVAEAKRNAEEEIAKYKEQQALADIALRRIADQAAAREMQWVRETRDSRLQLAEMEFRIETEKNLAQRATDDANAIRRRSLRALSYKHQQIEGLRAKAMRIIRGLLRLGFAAAISFSLFRGFKDSTILLTVLAFYSLISFYLFTARFERLTGKFVSLLISSRERDLFEMAENLGFNGKDWQAQATTELESDEINESGKVH